MTETIQIGGMSCQGCVSSVKRVLASLPIQSAQVNIGDATVQYDETVVTHRQIIEAIENAGYTPQENAS